MGPVADIQRGLYTTFRHFLLRDNILVEVSYCLLQVFTALYHFVYRHLSPQSTRSCPLSDHVYMTRQGRKFRTKSSRSAAIAKPLNVLNESVIFGKTSALKSGFPTRKDIIASPTPAPRTVLARNNRITRTLFIQPLASEEFVFVRLRSADIKPLTSIVTTAVTIRSEWPNLAQVTKHIGQFAYG
ncbi:hypothetical protein EVAR_93809_1 [Eumeta japonica]|uniref:Uncharacterized protein n=1 Tax=Eumeta variegata TaxID=151549 RepID=A0A4C1VBF5_EUMVA|nr:hypothetical protein EVAR_93809_1 [Eumeta japonica]